MEKLSRAELLKRLEVLENLVAEQAKTIASQPEKIAVLENVYRKTVIIYPSYSKMQKAQEET